VRISNYEGMAGTYQWYPCISVDSQNHLHVVWQGKATGFTEYQIWYVKYDGSWGNTVRISTFAGMENEPQYTPSIIADEDDNLYVLWQGRATGYMSVRPIWYAEFASWSIPEVLQPIGENRYANFLVSLAEPITVTDLKGIFDVGQDSIDLLMRFEVGQDSQDLSCKAEIRQIYSSDLFATVSIRHVGTPVELFAKVGVTHWQDLLCRFCIPTSYDFSGGMGIAFQWWGSGRGHQNVDFEMWSLTGGYIGRFPDGPAKWREIILSWDDLTEVESPDKSNIIGIYWTYHTHGVRRVDAIRIWINQSLYCKFIVRHAGFSRLFGKFEVQVTVDLYSYAEIRHSTSVEIYGHGVIRNIDSAELLGRFEVGQDFKDLKVKFEVSDMVNTYMEEGTGDITCPNGAETTLEGMTKTINGMKSGDEVILNFDCTMVETAIEFGPVIFRIKVDGVQIGKSVERDNASTAGTWKIPISFMRRYEIPGDGNYTFTVTWYYYDASPTFPPKINDGKRTLTILHIRN